ncbi:DinB family protein [Salegentibacter sp. F188]|uniref:DinB family protein n=1 Tax=Autumnicola patrickiae TaxID=3075591 RepID=A0ABU3E1Z7_9FLAO|nr:DinB family protein [Salegentibacter sp. F188]MDT0690023.1 DinB family protein [Salegentibacter sp. F188]
MKIASEDLISDLKARTLQNLRKAEQMKKLPLENLNHKVNDHSWSALECIKHLNLYGEYYLPEIEKRINQRDYAAEEKFASGKLGNYFAKMMLPGEKMKKIKTFRNKNPNGSKLDKEALEEFIIQQNKILDLLEKARKISLNKTKTSISITSFLKLKLGDTLRVVIYHNDRHMLQAQKALEIT